MSQDSHIPNLSHGAPIGSTNAGHLENPLSAWYADNDGPWAPIPLPSNDSDPRNGAYALPEQPPRSFFNYRDTIPPSETDTISVVNNNTLPSDSGYISFTKRSVAGASLCDEQLDNGTEFGSIVGDFAGLAADLNTHHAFDIIQKSPMPMDFLQSHWGPPFDPTQPAKLNASPGMSNLWCEDCKMQLKTNSEKKKHVKRHTKPHRCLVAGCPRQIGFGTINDLDRHKKSCHPELFGPDEFVYKCSLDKCAKTTKLWPRADNFRSHLRRVHKMNDIDDPYLEKYRHRPHMTGMTPGSETLALQRSGEAVFDHQSGTSPQSSWVFAQDMLHSSPDQTTRSKLNLPSISEQDGDSHTQLDDDVHWNRPQSANSNVSSLQVPNCNDRESRQVNSFASEAQGHHHTHDEISKESAQDVKYSLFSDKEELGDMDESPMDDEDEITLNDALHMGPERSSRFSINLNDENEVKRLIEVLQERGYLGPQGSDKAPSVAEETTKSEITVASSSKIPFGCRLCKKSFHRRCELRKHEKRHDKPFGCTFVGCTKRFGSKNDWKRHENSQHLMIEIWKCDEPHVENPSEPCGRISHRRESFKYHLSTTHNVRDASAVDAKVEQCRIGRNYDERFWCGFCEKIIQTQSKGQGAQTERFDHIGDHYAGRNKQPMKGQGDWRHVDPDDVGSNSMIASNEGPEKTPSEDTEIIDLSDSETKPHINTRAKRTRDTSGTTEGGPRKRNAAQA